MDLEIQELDSLLSDHFGRTPAASQCSSVDDSNEDFDYINEENEADSGTVAEIVDCRARDFLSQHGSVNASNDEQEFDVDSSDEEDTTLVYTNDDTDDDLAKVRRFVQDGCGCKKKCNVGLSISPIYDHILNTKELTKDENDIFIMSSLRNEKSTTTKRGKVRKRSIVSYIVFQKPVCRKTVMVVNDIGRSALEKVVEHFKENGLIPRKHGNSGKKPKHAITYDDVKRVVEYLQNFADTYGIPQPAAPRGSDSIPPVYLDSGKTKQSIHKEYVCSCEEAGVRFVHRTTFCEIWKNCLGHIKIASPRDDVCAICEGHRKRITDAVEENDKLEAADKFKEHVLNAQKEREVYSDCIKRAKETYNLGPGNRVNHYTFDFSQNVSLPHYARQIGPVYFMTLRKVQIFGVRIDGEPKQLNFLIDENETMGQDGTETHGPNAVISMLDMVLDKYGCGEASCSIHADNCPGQNKNRYMIGYFQWRVMTGRHDMIEYQMQVPGHARCLVDNGFGHLKKLYRRSNIETLESLTQVVNLSSTSNEAVRYPSWNWRDWKNFLAPLFGPVPNIRKYQYFRITSEEPGMVTLRTGVDAQEVKVTVAKDGVHIPYQRPPVVQTKGLSRQRQTYLYNTVRPYLSEANKDITCPCPLDL